MNTCEYEIWAGTYSRKCSDSIPYTEMPVIKLCGKPGINILLPTNALTKKYLNKRKQICLCEEHRAFVIDSIAPTQYKVIITAKGLDLL